MRAVLAAIVLALAGAAAQAEDKNTVIMPWTAEAEQGGFDEAQGGFKPQVFLLADDAGYDAFATLIDTSTAMVARHPDLVQRFVDASIEGWYSHMDGDPAPVNALIKQDNPEMSDAQIAYSIARMKQYGIVGSGDAKTLGIGAMTDAGWKSFFDLAIAAGLYRADVDYRKSYTLQFVNKGHGLAMSRGALNDGKDTSRVRPVLHPHAGTMAVARVMDRTHLSRFWHV